ncbi:MAG: Ldh family oxidoreductase [Planctomycetota bacterium]
MAERILPAELHNQIVAAAYQARGYTADEADQAARFCELAATHGIKTHNALKALHLDHLFGSGNAAHPGCVPGATIDKLPSRFAACQVWNANRKLGQAVAFEAIDTCIDLADQYGVGIVSVDQAFHYLWGGGYVMEAAKRGYIAYTNCTAALAEVVPFGGKFPTLGTNPHSWGFPTQDAVGFPIVIDWATSTVAMGRVQQFKREGSQLPPDAAVDAEGNPTQDPNEVAALLPFGRHKGYGLSLINEIVAAFIGGSLPTLRSRPERLPQAEALTSPPTDAADDLKDARAKSAEKTTPNFHFQVIHPDALSSGAFAAGRDRAANVQAVLADVMGHGNSTKQGGRAILPGQIEADFAQRTAQAGGLIFTDAELAEFAQLASENGMALDPATLTELTP